MSPHESRTTSQTTTAASVAVLVAVGALVLTTWLWGGSTAPDDAVTSPSAAPSRPVSASSSTPVDPVAVLRSWDHDRAAAWAAGDVAALAGLHVEDSRTGARDVAMLRRWTDRGLRVQGMRRQVLQVEVRRATEQRLVLLVTDRLAGAVAVRETDDARWDLPADRAETRRLVFRHAAGRWRLAASYERPLARIAATSGSDIS